jgi:hypothetical protein
MASQAVWRGDDPGFQTQALGNYPIKSDVADKDNIYLTDQGWVYRHFKNKEKTKFWDEIIWAGYVNPAVNANDPVDPMRDPDPDFVFGDGIQAVSGPYPTQDPTIGAATINGPDSGDKATAIAYSVVVGGTLASGNTFTWSVDGPGTAVIGTATGTFSGDTPAEADTNITFPTEGTYQVTCLLKSSATSTSGSVANHVFTAEVSVPDTIGTVTVNGQEHPQAGVGIVYSAVYTGTAPQNDVTYAWTATPSSGVTITQPGDNPEEAKVVFTTQASVTSTVIKCTLTDTDASDSGAFGELTVVPHFVIGTPVITGPTTSTAGAASTAFSISSYTGQSNPVPNDLTYQWSADPATGVTFGTATAATTTVTVAAAGDVDITLVVSSAKSEPTTAPTSNKLTLTAS